MEKRFILAIFLIVLILIIFNLKNFSPPPQSEKISEEEIQSRIEQLLSEAVYEPSIEGITVNSSLYTALVSHKGGLKSFKLQEYRVRDAGILQLEQKLNNIEQQFSQQAKYRDAETDSPLLYLIKKLRFQISHIRNFSKTEGIEMVSFGELYNGLLPPFLELRDKNNNLIWTEKESYKIASQGVDSIRLIQEVPDVGTITKEFIFNPEQYLIDIKIIVENTGSKVSEPHYLIITTGPDVGIDEGIRSFTNLNPVVFVDSRLRKQEFGRSSKGKTVEKIEYGEIGWAALQDKYFSKILIPKGKVSEAYINKNEHEEYTVGLKTGVPALAPSEKSEFSFGFYLGPKKLEYLYKVGRETTKIVDYGLFGNLFRIVHILKFFYRLTHNYGVSIILLTVLINLILLPLSLKSFKSMKEMRKLQPEMEKIRKEFKNDPQKMNAEVMELYRRHKVNPAGGCLPMLLQLPIFIGLFMTLRSVIELRGAHFILWIKDLSLPDTLYTLPFSIPFLGPDINILPLLMTGITFLQQKVSGSAGTSQMMMVFFPLMMLFIFYNFPSGLVLYFLCSNGINILEQLWINRASVKAK